jgi:23S rRNA maturation mini-RNase III
MHSGDTGLFTRSMRLDKSFAVCTTRAEGCLTDTRRSARRMGKRSKNSDSVATLRRAQDRLCQKSFGCEAVIAELIYAPKLT